MPQPSDPSKETAAEAYRRRRIEVALLLQRLLTEMDRHAERTRDEKTHWGHVGDMTKVRDDLITTVAFLAGVDPEAIERELRGG